MELRRLGANEVHLVKECMEELSVHHNEIAADFKGIYPYFAVDEHMDIMAKELEGGDAMLAAVLEGDSAAGFCNCTITRTSVRTMGLLTQLYVDKRCRGKGYGDLLMQEALDYFGENKVTLMDIRVVDGNDAVRFYEKYGFKLRLVVMSKMNG